MKTIRMAVIAGDGIGPEVIREGIRVLDTVAQLDGSFAFEWTHFPWGCDYYLKTGRMMPEDGIETLSRFDAIYLGAVGAPGVPDHISLWDLLLRIRKSIRNMRVCDGLCDCLPFPDSSFDVVMSGHVVGDRFREEVDELTRVARPGGWLLDVPGDQHRKTRPNEQLLSDGWEELAYTGTFGETTYRYRKQVQK